MIDLHIHTNMSDGQFSPAETVRLAAQKGVSCIAITDHDTVAGFDEARRAASEVGIECISGIEISVQGNRELHILGYHIDCGNPGLTEACDNFIRLREQRVSRIFTYLSQNGVLLTEEQLQRHVRQRAAGRPHFARAMLDAGFVSSIQEAYDRYLGTPEFDSVERTKPAARDGLKMILDAGGVPVLAHPALLKLDDENVQALISDLVDAGLKGLECYYSRHTPEQTAQYLKYAEKFGLIVTAGSDFHGENNKPGIEIGDCGQVIKETDCKGIIDRLRSAATINPGTEPEPRNLSGMCNGKRAGLGSMVVSPACNK